MLLAKALPDEFCRGYKGRLQAINLHASPTDIIRHLRMHLNLHTEPEAVVLANASGLRPEAFIKQHTLLPFFRAVAIQYSHVKHGDPASPAVIKHTAMKSAAQGAFLCPDCIAEDRNFWGISYWRRTHQLPGIDWCLKHRTPLHVAPSIKAFDFLPGDIAEEAYPLPNGTLFLENAALQRYAEIAAGLLEFDQPLSPLVTGLVLMKRATNIGLPLSIQNKRPLLSYTILEQLPHLWLFAHYPMLQNKAPERIHRALEIATQHCHSSIPAVITLTILFESADEALSFWSAQFKDQPMQPNLQRGTEPETLNDKEIVNHGMASKSSHTQGFR